MLVLSRRPGSSILIGHDVTVTVELVAGDEVCLRVDSERPVAVRRLDERDLITQLESRGKRWDPARMHVLSRRPRPGLLIDEDVILAVQSINNESVRIGIDAPPHVLIYREEVYQQMQDANRSALNESADDLSGLAGLYTRPAPGS